MVSYLPGTQIEMDLKREDTEYILNNIFSMGGLVLSQVSHLGDIEPYTVQNWVKRGFCTSPESKKYNKKQFCRIITINMLKDSLSITEITGLLSYINGHLDDESDNMIDDDRLYIYFVKVISCLDSMSDENINMAVEKVTEGYEEPFSGGKTRLRKALTVMTYAYLSSKIRKKATILMTTLDEV